MSFSITFQNFLHLTAFLNKFLCKLIVSVIRFLFSLRCCTQQLECPSEFGMKHKIKLSVKQKEISDWQVFFAFLCLVCFFFWNISSCQVSLPPKSHAYASNKQLLNDSLNSLFSSCRNQAGAHLQLDLATSHLAVPLRETQKHWDKEFWQT